MKYNELKYNELKYNELKYNELKYNELKYNEFLKRSQRMRDNDNHHELTKQPPNFSSIPIFLEFI
jgi:hypothetical protein